MCSHLATKSRVLARPAAHFGHDVVSHLDMLSTFDRKLIVLCPLMGMAQPFGWANLSVQVTTLQISAA